VFGGRVVGMKQTLLTICLIVFALPSWSDDISDFKIHGLGIGVSLLEFMTQDKIILSSFPSHFNGGIDDEFLEVSGIGDLDIFSDKENLMFASVTIKNHDKEFLIHGIQIFEKAYNYDGCVKRFNEFTRKIDYFFPKIKSKESRKDENEFIQKVYMFKTWFKGEAEIYYMCQNAFNIFISSSELVSWRRGPLYVELK